MRTKKPVNEKEEKCCGTATRNLGTAAAAVGCLGDCTSKCGFNGSRNQLDLSQGLWICAKANDALTRAIRRWLGVPKIVSMSKSELETLGGIEKVELGEGDILLTHED